jgi:hypothetical protein
MNSKNIEKIWENIKFYLQREKTGCDWRKSAVGEKAKVSSTSFFFFRKYVIPLF